MAVAVAVASLLLVVLSSSSLVADVDAAPHLQVVSDNAVIALGKHQDTLIKRTGADELTLPRTLAIGDADTNVTRTDPGELTVNANLVMSAANSATMTLHDSVTPVGQRIQTLEQSVSMPMNDVDWSLSPSHAFSHMSTFTGSVGNDRLGDLVSVHGKYALVGGSWSSSGGVTAAGAAWIYQRVGRTWLEVAHLSASDAEVNALFGVSGQIYGDVAVVGAYQATSAGFSQAGKAYVFTRRGYVWAEAQVLEASDPATGAKFGFAVSIHGKHLFLGSYGHAAGGFANAGQAYVFVRGDDELFTEHAILSATDKATNAQFGWPISLHGNYALIGAYKHPLPGSESGQAYIFVRDGTSWSEQAILVPSDIAAGDWFGSAASLYGRYAVVSSRYGGASNEGSSYVFVRDGVTWSQQAILSDPSATAVFGIGISLYGNVLVCGQDAPAAVHVFVREQTTWSKYATITEPTPFAGSGFGWTVSLYGDYLWVGATLWNTNFGQAYAFGVPPAPVATRVPPLMVETAVDSGLAEHTTIVASDSQSGADFGVSIASHGNYLIVGAQFHDAVTPAAMTNSGQAYVYVWMASAWHEQAILVASDQAIGTYFGHYVALYGEYALVGSNAATSGGLQHAGQVYVFVRDGVTWSEQTILSASDKIASGFFGTSLAMNDRGYAMVGSGGTAGAVPNAGRIYVFKRNGTVWSEEATLTASDAFSSSGFAGNVAMSGNYAVVGADNHAVGGTTGVGQAYIFAFDGTVWQEQARLTASNRQGNQRFGSAIAIDGDTVVIGTRVGNQAYVFVRQGGRQWLEQSILTPSVIGAGDEGFGMTAVAVQSDQVVLGAMNFDTGVTADTGKLYVFSRVGVHWSEMAVLLRAVPEANALFGAALALNGQFVFGTATTTGLSGGGELYQYRLASHGSATEFLNDKYARVTAVDAWNEWRVAEASKRVDCDEWGVNCVE